MTSLVVLFSYQIKSRKVRQLQKFYQKSYAVILTDLSNAIKNCGRKFRFINTLKGWVDNFNLGL